MKFIEVILKVSERCNINCSYCYFFNKENQDYKRRPPVIEQTTIDALGDFLVQAAQEYQLEFIQIDLHGGEPLLMKKERFRNMCLSLRERISGVCPVRFSLQTNAMLIDDEWVDIFEELNVYVGVSIDGVKEQNDKFRVDHQGRGTFERAVSGLRCLQTAERARRFTTGYSVLAVIDPEYSAKEWYELFARRLGVKRLHAILPDYTHDDFDSSKIDSFTRFLNELFLLWSADDVARPSIRMFSDTLAVLAGGVSKPLEKMNEHSDTLAFTVASDGELDPPDDLRNVMAKNFGAGLSVFTHSFTDFVKSHDFSTVRTQIKTIPASCAKCAWQAACYMGPQNSQSQSQRFSLIDKFDNPSVYCAAYQDLFTNIAVQLINSGILQSEIESRLAKV